MSKNYTHGLYTPKNPQKYVGDVNKIHYRSSWELELHKFFDNNTHVLKWGSEVVAIPYLKPTTGKVHKYYPDYWVEYVTKNGEIIQELIEVKPSQQTRLSRSKNPKTRLYESITLAINIRKWQAAKVWCESVHKKTGRKINFRVITERVIFH